MMLRRALLNLTLACVAAAQTEPRIEDKKHFSSVFGEERNYRVFLPAGYDANTTDRYPVIYFFHGWSERYNRPPRGGPGYDSGTEYGGDTIARFTAQNRVIVVKWDGYNPRTPGESYPRPYNISPVETYRQFPLYFPELVRHIDQTYRTIADRDHRATAGLSMGGFMSFWVAGKYPHLVGSASNFMGSSEFDVGPNEFPSEYRHTEMYGNYDGLRTRLVTGSRDFIRWYHRQMNLVWDLRRTNFEHEEFDSEHGTPGMAKTLAFHMAAFRDPMPRPAIWRHVDVYPVFEVWGYSVRTDRDAPGFTILEQVSRSGFRISVREWMPHGRLLPATSVRIATDALYTAGKRYQVSDINVTSGDATQSWLRADPAGRLHIQTDGGVHEIGIAEAREPIVTVAGWSMDGDRVRLRLLNKGPGAASVVSGSVQGQSFSVSKLAFGEVAQTGPIAIDRKRRAAALIGGVEHPLDLPLQQETSARTDVVVLDGARNQVWQKAVQATEMTFGAGNGDGIAQAGEQVVLGIRDGAALRLAEVVTAHPCVDISRRVSDPWGEYDHVGATAKYTIVQLAATCSDAGEIPLEFEYQLPNKPEHTLKRGRIAIRVSGQDKTAPQVETVRLRGWNALEVKLTDGAKVAKAVATLSEGESGLTVALNDDGTGADRARGDGLFTGLAPNPRPGTWSVRIDAEDEFGNRATEGAARTISIPARAK